MKFRFHTIVLITFKINFMKFKVLDIKLKTTFRIFTIGHSHLRFENNSIITVYMSDQNIHKFGHK
jgi:hypothetical protein